MRTRSPGSPACATSMTCPPTSTRATVPAPLDDPPSRMVSTPTKRATSSEAGARNTWAAVIELNETAANEHADAVAERHGLAAIMGHQHRRRALLRGGCGARSSMQGLARRADPARRTARRAAAAQAPARGPGPAPCAAPRRPRACAPAAGARSRDPEPREPRVHRGAARRRRTPRKREAQGDVVPHRGVCQERFLEDARHAPPDRERAWPGSPRRRWKRTTPAVTRLEQAQHAEQRRLARAVGADHREDLARVRTASAETSSTRSVARGVTPDAVQRRRPAATRQDEGSTWIEPRCMEMRQCGSPPMSRISYTRRGTSSSRS